MPREVFVTSTYKFVVPDDARDDADKAHLWMHGVCESLRGLELWTDTGEKAGPIHVTGRVVMTGDDNERYKTAVAVFGEKFVRINPIDNSIEFYSEGADVWRPWSY